MVRETYNIWREVNEARKGEVRREAAVAMALFDRRASALPAVAYGQTVYPDIPVPILNNDLIRRIGVSP